MRARSLELTYPRVLLAALLVVALVAGGFAAATSSAAFGSYNPGWDGSRELRLLADSHGDTTVARNTAAYGRADADNTTAIVLAPKQPYDATDVDRIENFLARGGTLVVAGDFGANANRLLDALGATSRIDGRIVRDERFYYRSPALPVATNLSRPLADRATSLTLNHGSVVDPGANATVLARTSGYAYLDENRNAKLDDAENLSAYPVVVAEPVESGRVVVVSDPSVFINVMLDRDGNHAFARYLVSQRQHVLLDYSHTADFPLAAIAVLAVKDSWLLQVLVGVGVLAALAVLGDTENVAGRVRDLLGRERTGEREDGVVSEDAVVAAVADRHPDWDEDELRRVTQTIRTGESEKLHDD